jgi:hypothetical protein
MCCIALQRLEPGHFTDQLRALHTPGVSLTRAVLPSLLNELWSLETYRSAERSARQAE